MFNKIIIEKLHTRKIETINVQITQEQSMPCSILIKL